MKMTKQAYALPSKVDSRDNSATRRICFYWEDLLLNIVKKILIVQIYVKKVKIQYFCHTKSVKKMH